jgi:hypothetical protein
MGNSYTTSLRLIIKLRSHVHHFMQQPNVSFKNTDNNESLNGTLHLQGEHVS